MRPPKVYWRYLRRDWSTNGWEPTDTGWLLTILLEILVIKIGLESDQIGDLEVTKFTQFLNQKPSEMGDTIAGLFAAVAFIWIIVTVFLQSKELRLARGEYKKMAQAQREQVALLAKQGHIFQAEQEDREARSRARLVDQLTASLRWKLAATPIQWVGEADAEGHVSFLNLWHFRGGSEPQPSDEDFFKIARESIRRITATVTEFEIRTPIARFPHRYELQLVRHDVAVVLDHIQGLAKTDQVRLGRLMLPEFLEALDTVIAESNLWGEGIAQ